ncbi:MAG: hypothetical protein ACI9ZT_001465 [Gammaproteobacteria bacterium]|jgi:hypothetical protein
MFSKDTGLLTDDDTNEVEISIKIKFKEKVDNIIADCRMVYVAKHDEISGKESFFVGLQVIDFKGKSLDVIKRLIKEKSQILLIPTELKLTTFLQRNNLTFKLFKCCSVINYFLFFTCEFSLGSLFSFCKTFI